MGAFEHRAKTHPTSMDNPRDLKPILDKVRAIVSSAKDCVDKNPGKPLSEIWDCVVEGTRKRSAGAERKKKEHLRKKPQKPKRLPPK